MARTDRTFSDRDVIRVFENHLTKKERRKVTEFFLDRFLQTDQSINFIVAAVTAAILTAIVFRLRLPPTITAVLFTALLEELTRRVVREVVEGVRTQLNV